MQSNTSLFTITHTNLLIEFIENKTGITCQKYSASILSIFCSITVDFCSITESPGEDAFQVKITSSVSGRLRAWVQKLDRHDGSFIIRYRMFASYPDLTIEITHKGKHVANSPYRLQGLFLVLLLLQSFC